MALTKNIRIYAFIVVAALALGACAKKDSDFKARRNASGAKYVNDTQSANADKNAQMMGYDTDILLVQNPTAVNGVLSIDSYIKVNSMNYKITTTHSQVGVDSMTNQTFEGANFQVVGRCGSNSCNPYYLVVSISRNGQNIKQTAMKKYFYYNNQDSSNDLIMSLSGNEFMNINQIIQTLDAASVSSSLDSGGGGF